MSIPATPATKFYRDVAATRKAWTLEEPGFEGEFIVFKMATGTEVVPFWSSLSRIEKQIKDIEKYRPYKAAEVSWDEFTEKQLELFEREKLFIGLNWSGKTSTGYDRDALGVVTTLPWIYPTLCTAIWRPLSGERP